VNKIKILFLAANPLTTSRLDLEEELHGVEQELRAVLKDPLVCFLQEESIAT
jgi:hypothetical protein